MLALQAELASAIAREINVRLTPSEQSRLTAAPSVNPEAHDAYLKGRYFFNRPSDENLQKAIAQFEEAVRLSPNFAPAFSGLSDAYLWAGYNEGFLTATEARPKAKAAAEKAVAIGRQLRRSAHVARRVQAVLRIRLAGMRARIPASVRAQPELRVRARSVRHGAGVHRDGSTKRSPRASGRSHWTRCRRRFWSMPRCRSMFQRNSAPAKALARKAAELDPTYFFPVMIDGWADLEVGKFRDGDPALKKAKAMECAAVRDGVSRVRATAPRAIAPARWRSSRSSRRCPRMARCCPFNLALVYLGLGDHARALDNLERAHAADSQMMAWIGHDAMFDPLRAEPRFEALMKKSNFVDSSSSNGGPALRRPPRRPPHRRPTSIWWRPRTRGPS